MKLGRLLIYSLVLILVVPLSFPRGSGENFSGVTYTTPSTTTTSSVTSYGAGPYYPDCFKAENESYNHALLKAICAEPIHSLIPSGYKYYVGHDEPSIQFFSITSGSGNSLQWKIQLPQTDPTPTQNGASVANFELYPAFWFSLAVCDPNSYPFGACTADSDANNPASAGSALLELQFYPPNLGCSNTQWCARLTIDSYEQNSNCLEPINSAFITTDGTTGGPLLLMFPGDNILITIKDTANAMENDVNDLSGSATGFMVASSANGFFNTNHNTCATSLFSFHPEYSTASSGNVVPWTSLQANVNFAFEIGHWELCGIVLLGFCLTLPDGGDTDDVNCGTAGGVGGCTGADGDHDGASYVADWPDGNSAHPSTLIISSSLGNGVGPLSFSSGSYQASYVTVHFATTQSTSSGSFYPFYSQTGTGSSCVFNFGNDLPGTTNDFSKTSQYGTTISNPCVPVSQTLTATVTLTTTQTFTLYSAVATSTVTSYTSASTSTSTITTVTTVVLVPVTSTLQSLQSQTSFTTTTINSYTSTSTSTSTIPVVTTVTVGPPTTTIQTTQILTSTGTATVTGVTTTTTTSYTGTLTATSTTIVVTTVTATSSFFAGSLLALLSILGLAVRFGFQVSKGRTIPELRQRLGRRCLRS